MDILVYNLSEEANNYGWRDPLLVTEDKDKGGAGTDHIIQLAAETGGLATGSYTFLLVWNDEQCRIVTVSVTASEVAAREVGVYSGEITR